MYKFRNIFPLIIFLLSFVFPPKTLAQFPNFSIATTYEIKEKEITDGDILALSAEEKALVKSEVAYDDRMYGVYIENPKIVYRQAGLNEPVVKTGEIEVNVTTYGGDIAIGDYITSSPIEGRGQKATEVSGYILGVSLGEFTDKDGTEIVFQEKSYRRGKVKIAMGIGPASPVLNKATGGILGTLRFISSSFLYNLSTSKQAEKIFRYIMAGLVALVSLVVSIYFFGKNVSKGIESIGRNPLAKQTIQFMIIINVILIALVALGGVGLGLAILSY